MLVRAHAADLTSVNVAGGPSRIMAFMFKRILVPVDASPASSAGLRTAVALARDQKARLRLLHLAKQIPAGRRKAEGMSGSELFDALREHGTRLLERRAALCRARGVRAETSLYVGLAGRPAKIVLAEAQKWRADLIVMGTEGRRGLRRMVLGSDAEAVLRAAPMPVLLTRR